MSIITKTEGHYIINSAAVSLNGTVVSYRDDAVVQEFVTEAEMLAAHELQFPEQYIVDEPAEPEEPV
jgi:hypothetical protein